MRSLTHLLICLHCFMVMSGAHYLGQCSCFSHFLNGLNNNFLDICHIAVLSEKISIEETFFGQAYSKRLPLPRVEDKGSKRSRRLLSLI